MKLRERLDMTDLRILHTLEEHGTKLSTKELSEILDIPARTIRYRLQKLKEKKVMYPDHVQTHERKIGLAEYVVLVQRNPKKDAQLKKVFEEVPLFYYHAMIFGKFEGYLAHILYSLTTPRTVPNILEFMKKKELILDYHMLDIVDYARRGAMLRELFVDDQAEDGKQNISQEASWDWEPWAESIPDTIGSGESPDLEFEESPQIVSFDAKDIELLKNKILDPDITLRELGEILDLSQPQVHNRISRLEESGIIKAYYPTLAPFESVVVVGCVIRSSNHGEAILNCLNKIPFYLLFAIESKSFYQVRFAVPSTELNGFLWAIEHIREYTDDMFVQIQLKGKSKGHGHIYSLYDHDKGGWQLSEEEAIKKIDDICE